MESFGEILVASSDLELRRSIVTILRRLGADPICASTVSQSREALAEHSVGLVFCDRQFADGTYRDLLKYVRSCMSEDKTRVVLTTSFVNPGEYHEAKQSGVFDVIASPEHAVAVEWMVILAQRDALRYRELALLSRSPAAVGLRAAAAAKA
jgi:DNA-binding NtrC family response regulator